jgi:acetyl-CoA synthetase
MSAYAWRPPADAMTSTNVGRFMTEHGVADIEELRARSVKDPEWFWDAVVKFLDIRFDVPYSEVLDTTGGIPWSKWFVGGELSFARQCLDHPGGDPAVVWEGEDGSVRRWNYAALRVNVAMIAEQLVEAGVVAGDRVGIFMPMVPEAVAALLAVAQLGAVFLPLFSGYGPDAIAKRLADAEAKVLLTTSSTSRRGKRIDMRKTAAQAAELFPTNVMVLDRIDHPDTAVGTGTSPPDLAFDSEHPLFVAYTSGTTGRPKGSVHVHGGWLVKVAEEGAFQTDCRRGDTLFWFTDMGWIMGPWEITAALANGATLALFEGAPDWPEPDRLWAFVERHGITILGISPTLIRSLMSHGDEPVRRHDLSQLRVLGSTGEPWNEAPWRWYFDVVGGGRCPIINISGGTEVGACFLSPHPVEPLKPMTLGGPALGLAVDVFDDNGEPVRGQVGELVCTAPWPGMTRGLWRDPARYLETYWSRWPGVWVHGDWASIDADGDWFLHGRSDDTIKVAGKRLGPAEVESVLVSHPAVVEAAAVGIPDEVKGESLWCFVVLTPGAEPTDELRAELTALVADKVGTSFRPAAVRFTSALPKTRNAKVLRRAIRAAVTGADAGDLSSLEDPATVDAVKAAM